MPLSLRLLKANEAGRQSWSTVMLFGMFTTFSYLLIFVMVRGEDHRMGILTRKTVRWSRYACSISAARSTNSRIL